MKTLEQIKDEVCLKKHNHQFYLVNVRRHSSEIEKVQDEAAQLYAEEFAKAFGEWCLSEEGEGFRFEQSTREGRLITTEELLTEFKSSLKEKA